MSLWTYFHIKRKIRSPHRRVKNILNLIQRASFCTCLKGSYTLEAAIIIPLIAGYLVTLLSFFYILEIQCAVDEALLYAGRKTAVESCVVKSEEALFLSAEAYMLYALQEQPLINRYLQHGIWGVHLWRSDFYGEEIVLRADYTVRLPISFGEIGKIRLSSQNCFQKWSHDTEEEERETSVYITKYGEVYHAELTCRTLQLSVKSSTIEKIPFLRGKNGQRYYECTRCEWNDSTEERVYYTDYGTLYHKDISCSAIKRMIERINLEEVGDRRPCSFCYGL